MSKLLISDDGAVIRWVNEVTGAEWAAGAPTLAEWQRLCRGNQTADSLARGIFRWVDGIDEKEVIVVFSPYGGLDFNVTYSAADGELTRITEAR